MTTDLWVDAGPFRAHLRHLMGAGPVTSAEVAAMAGVSRRAADHLLTGRNGRPLRRICPETARLLLAVTPAQVRALRWCGMPATDAREYLEQLRAAGWSGPELGSRVGLSQAELADLATGASQCTRLVTLRLQVAAQDVGRSELSPSRGAQAGRLRITDHAA